MTAADSPTPARRFSPSLIAGIVALIVLVAIVASALALRYGGPSATTSAEQACIDAASPMSTFVAEESFSVDDVVTQHSDDLEGWPQVAKDLELQVDPEDDVETFWVIGTVDDADAVCIIDFTEGELLTEPQFVEAAAFDEFR